MESRRGTLAAHGSPVIPVETGALGQHAQAWEDANKDVNANAAAWAQAHHIDCVVDHIAEADCSFGPAPGLTQPTLCDDIESVSCAAESGSAAPTVVSESAFDLGILTRWLGHQDIV